MNVVEDCPCLPDGAAHPPGQPDQISGRFPGQRHRRDQLEVVSAFRDESGLQPTFGAQRGDAHPRLQRGQGVGYRHRRFNVARRATAGENHRDRPHP